MNRKGGFNSVASVVIGVLLAAFIIFFAGPAVMDVVAENMKCPKKKTCFLAEHKQTKKVTCRHNENDPWQWLLDDDGNKQECGNGQEDKEKPIATKKVIITYTSVPKATKTPKPKKEAESTPTAFQPITRDGVEPTSTCTVAVEYIQTPQSTQDCPWCELMTRLVDANERQASAQETMAAR